MPVLSPNSVSILPPNQTSGGSLKEKSSGLRYNTQKSPDAALWSTAADAFSNAQSQIDNITNALRAPLPQPSVFQITDRSGALVAEIGNLTGSNNQAFEGIWGKNLYVGGTGPDNAPFFANGQQVIIGQNGQVFVLDPYGDIGAWLGTQSELPKNVTGAVNNGSGAIRLTVTAHGWVTGDQVHVANVGGVPNAAGQWVITVIDANTIDLIGSTFAGGYAGGGTAQRYFTGGLFSTIAVGGAKRVTNVTNNGSGLDRVTVPAHGYSSGYAVVLTGVNGVPNINGVSWNINVIDANNFDLIGSVFSGAYAGGGLSLNWPTASLIARDDGSITITNAEIILNGTNSTIVIDPTTGSITITGTTGPPFFRTTLESGIITLTQVGTGANSNIASISSDSIQVTSGTSRQFGVELFGSGQILSYTSVPSDVWAERLIGYSAATAQGPVLLLQQIRGAPFSTSASVAGDIMGEFGGSSALDLTPLALVTPTGSMRVIATQTQTNVAKGTRVSFAVTGNGTTTPFVAVTIDQSGSLGVGTTTPGFSLDVTGGINAGTGYFIAGTPGIDLSTSFGASLSVGTGSAITSVTGPGVTGTTSGVFVTGVTLNLTGNTFSKGLLTA